MGDIGAGTSVCLDIVCFYPESAHLQKVDSPSMFVGLGSVFQCCTEGACIRTKMHAHWAGDKGGKGKEGSLDSTPDPCSKNLKLRVLAQTFKNPKTSSEYQSCSHFCFVKRLFRSLSLLLTHFRLCVHVRCISVPNHGFRPPSLALPLRKKYSLPPHSEGRVEERTNSRRL